MREEFQKIIDTIKEISQDEFNKIWDEDLKEFDGVGPTVEEFLLHCHKFVFKNSPPNTGKINTFDQKFTSGFFISNFRFYETGTKSCILY